MDRQMRVMNALGVARARDNHYWMVGVYSGLVTVSGLAALRGKFPKPAAVPLTMATVAIAYNYDLAWGTKMTRIRGEYFRIMANEHDQWFFSEEADERIRKEALKK